MSDVCRSNASPRPMGFLRPVFVDAFFSRTSRRVFSSIPRPLSRMRMSNWSWIASSITVMRSTVAPAASEFMPMSRMFSESSSNILLQLLLAESRNLVGRKFAVHIVADGDCGRQRAGPDASRRLKAEQTVFRRFALFDAELLAEAFHHGRRAADVAGGARTNHDLVLPAGHDGEKVVERGDAVHMRQRQLHRRGDVPKHVRREIPETVLRRVEHLDERRRLEVVMLQRLIERCETLVATGVMRQKRGCGPA